MNTIGLALGGGAALGAAYAAGPPVSAIEDAVRNAAWSTFGRLTLTPRAHRQGGGLSFSVR